MTLSVCPALAEKRWVPASILSRSNPLPKRSSATASCRKITRTDATEDALAAVGAVTVADDKPPEWVTVLSDAHEAPRRRAGPDPGASLPDPRRDPQIWWVFGYPLRCGLWWIII